MGPWQMQFNSSHIDLWFNCFPDSAWDARICEVERELSDLHAARAAHRYFSDRLTGRAPLSSSLFRPTRPQGVLIILGQKSPMTPAELHAEMIRRDWLEQSSKAKKSFYSTLSRMRSEERLYQFADGTYCLLVDRRS